MIVTIHEKFHEIADSQKNSGVDIKVTVVALQTDEPTA